MPDTIRDRLAARGLSLPAAPAPAANYLPFVQSGSLLFVSGQISQDESGLILGKLGADMDITAGQHAAQCCALSLLAQVAAACDGDLERLARVVKLTGFVNCTADFTDHPKVINGASDLMADLLGDRGKHARAAVGSSSLPLGVAVEVEGVFELA